MKKRLGQITQCLVRGQMCIFCGQYGAIEELKAGEGDRGSIGVP